MTSPTTVDAAVSTRFLMQFMWLSVATAVATVVIKGVAAMLTGSVGLLSDALESCVNLVAAVVALWALSLSAKPADHNHDFGHGKAEYMSSAVEGALIFVAAAAIIVSAIQRFVHPQPIEEIGLGLILSTAASVMNGLVGVLLVREGRKHRSIVLEADGRHLLTDVWTSVGVIAGIVAIIVTGWGWIDPVIAIAVGVNILFTGASLVRRSVVGLLDAALPAEELDIIADAMQSVIGDQPVHVKELLTRESGRQRFVQATVLVPGGWTVQRSHDLADRFEAVIESALAETQVFIHIEPDTPVSRTVGGIGQVEPHGD